MPYDGSMFGLVRAADNTLVAFGLRGNVQHSQDGGATWLEVDSPTLRSLMGGVAGRGGVILVGADGAVLSGTPPGALTETIHPDGESLAAIARIEGDRYVLVGMGGVRTWSP